MSGLSERYKTLGQLRAQLQMRLGFVAVGPGSLNNRDTMNSILQEGHELVCTEVDVKTFRRRTVIKLVKDSSRYDWHNDVLDEDIDPTRIISIWVNIADRTRIPLCQGITESDRAFEDYQTYPTRWDDMDGQMELWPVPDQTYDLIVEYTAPQSRFERDSDRPSVPDRLVFMYALSMGKAHYRHPDASYKAAQHENQRYFLGGNQDGGPEQVVRTTNGYMLRTR
jgi:hypothetical protein